MADEQGQEIRAIAAVILDQFGGPMLADAEFNIKRAKQFLEKLKARGFTVGRLPNDGEQSDRLVE